MIKEIFDNEKYDKEVDTNYDKNNDAKTINMTKLMRTSSPIFYKNQINFKSHKKLRNNRRLFSRKQKIIMKKTYLKIQRETTIKKTKKTSC